MTAKSRRDFIRASSLLVAGSAVPGGLGIARCAHAFGSHEIRVGLIGCGRCGTDAAIRALRTASGPIKLVALADVFGDRIQAAYRRINSLHAGAVEVPQEQRFVGLDAYRELLQVDMQLVILAVPPGFRPLHLEAAVAAGKHVFLELPVAVDPPGVRRVLHAAEVARQKNVAVAIGMPHRHEPAYRETIAQLHDGVIGEPIVLRVYRNVGGVRPRPRQPRQTDLEYQLRNGQFFPWLSGDQIVDQHVHNLDVGNWLMRSHPVSANGQGGRDCRLRDGALGRDLSPTFDQFFCEFVYASGTRMFSQCRRLGNCWNAVAEHVQATRGHADISGGKIYDSARQRQWQTRASRDGRQPQYQDLIAALRAGEISQDVEPGALSTLTAIMGRMAAYSGQQVHWDGVCASESLLCHTDALTSLDDPAPVSSGEDGLRDVPVPTQHSGIV